MGLLSSLGGLAGSFFGGPIGGVLGGAVGGFFDQDNDRSYASAQQAMANQYNAEEAARNRTFQSEQAQMNRDFQERMSGSAYQRAMADMSLAGLNPMLAYSQGGSTTPVGSMASGSQASYPTGAGAAALSAESSSRSADAAMISASASASQAATAAKIGNETVEKIKADVNNVQSVTQQVYQTIDNLKVQRDNLVKEGYNLTEVGNQIRATIEKLQVEVPKINTEGFLNEARTKLTEMETQLRGFDVSAASDMGNFGRNAGQLKPLIDILKMILQVGGRK